MYEFINLTVRDAMTSAPMTTTADTPLREVERIFDEHDFNGIPVLNDEGELIGVVTKFDLLKAFTLTSKTIIPHYDEIMNHPVKAVMLQEPATVTPDLPLSRVLQRLVEMRIKSFPVVEGNRLIITRHCEE